jgi:hypothetical protein
MVKFSIGGENQNSMDNNNAIAIDDGAGRNKGSTDRNRMHVAMTKYTPMQVRVKSVFRIQMANRNMLAR